MPITHFLELYPCVIRVINAYIQVFTMALMILTFHH